MTGELNAGENRKNDVKIVVPLEHLSNFWRTLNMLLINCELSFPLTWFKDCAIAARACNEKFVGTGTDENPQFLNLKVYQNVHLK